MKKYNFNTSNVTIKLPKPWCGLAEQVNFNTSNVTIKQAFRERRDYRAQISIHLMLLLNFFIIKIKRKEFNISIHLMLLLNEQPNEMGAYDR